MRLSVVFRWMWIGLSDECSILFFQWWHIRSLPLHILIWVEFVVALGSFLVWSSGPISVFKNSESVSTFGLGWDCHVFIGWVIMVHIRRVFLSVLSMGFRFEAARSISHYWDRWLVVALGRFVVCIHSCPNCVFRKSESFPKFESGWGYQLFSDECGLGYLMSVPFCSFSDDIFEAYLYIFLFESSSL